MSIKFIIGKPPANTRLDSESGWLRVPGYGESMPIMLKAIGIGLALAALLAFAWRSVIPNGLPIETHPAISSIVFVFLIATVVHEICHLVLFPKFGLQHATIGIWPQMGALFAQYMQPVTRSRFIIATLAPAVLICILPLLLGAVGFAVPPFLQWAGIVNGVAVGADLLAVVQLLRHTPGTALVLESNHALFYRER